MKAVIIVSDLHIGSHSGLCPVEGIHLDGGGSYEPSKHQAEVWSCWRHFWDSWVPAITKLATVTAVVINGDTIDGNHHEVVDIISNVQNQEAAAYDILKPIRERYPNFYLVRGTEAHDKKSGQSSEAIAKRLEAVRNLETGDYSFYQVTLKLDDVPIQCAHHIGTTTSTAYETSAPMRELTAGFVEAGQWGQEMPRIMVRSHRHRFSIISIPCTTGLTELVCTPGWQLRTPNLEKNDRMRYPHLGGIVILAEGNQCRIFSKIYKIQPPQPIRL